MSSKDLLQPVQKKYLSPRECFCSTEPTLVSTILGSCVAVTFYDPVTLSGSIFHAFLPEIDADNTQENKVCDFVDSSICHVLSGYRMKGVDLSRLEVKLFGGSRVLVNAVPVSYKGAISVGERNVSVARRVLGEWGMEIIAEDTGGVAGRKLLFLTHTGGVWIKKLGKHLPA